MRRPDGGLTVVELMITLIVAGLVTGSTFIFFVGQERVYDTQTKLLNVQQNLWAALETVARHVRAAGTGMAGCVAPDAAPPAGPTPPASGLRAYRAGQGILRIAPLWIANGAAGAPDELTVAFGAGTSGLYRDAGLQGDLPPDAPLAPLATPPGQSASFRADEFIVLADLAAVPRSGTGDRGCTLFQITDILGATDTLVRAPTSPWNPPTDVAGLMPWGYAAGASDAAGIRNLGRLAWVRFAIDASGPEPPRLTMDDVMDDAPPQVLAEGIEDLQIAYACDLAPAGAPDGALSEASDPAGRNEDEWVFNQPGDAPPAACRQPSAVRLTLIGRSLTADATLLVAGDPAVSAPFKPAVEDAAPGPPDDAYRHRVLTTTIYPRN